LEVRRNDELLTLQGLRQRTLLAVLLTEAGSVVSNDRLAELVWDGEPPGDAHGTIQVYVSKLRRTLAPPASPHAADHVLVTRSPGYMLDAPKDAIDASRFTRVCDDAAGHLREGRAHEALGLLDDGLSWWRGEPYADFTFFGFAQSEIARLTELRWRALEDRAEALMALGQHRRAAPELDGLVKAAPLRERLRAQLALALYRSGRQADALRCLAEGRATLAEELGLEPSPELQRLEQQILTHAPALGQEPESAHVVISEHPVPVRRPALSSGDRRAIVGRADEVRRLTTLLEHVSTGRGGLALITGEPGIGKTCLAEEAARRAGETGVSVHWGRCSELDGAPAFWPWIQVLRSIWASGDTPPPDDILGALVPAPGASEAVEAVLDRDAARFRLYDAVSRYLVAAAARAPMVIVLDDLHWADVASLRLLRFLAPQVTTAPIGVVVTMRDSVVSQALDDVRADVARLPSVERFELTAFGHAEVAELAATLTGGSVTDATVDVLLRRSGGNPFFLAELIHLGQAGAGGIPSGVRDVIERRVTALAADTQSLLAVASCLPADFLVAVIARVLERPPAEMLDDVHEATTARLIVEVEGQPGAFRFAHSLVRETVYALLPAIRRADHHHRIARALEAGTERDDEIVAHLAHHYCESLPVGSTADAVRWSLESGRRALARWAADEARAQFEVALDLARLHGGVDHATLVDLLTACGQARRFLGDPQARTLLDEAMSLARSIDDPVRLARAALATGSDAWGLNAQFGRVDDAVTSALEAVLPRLGTEHAELRVSATARLACEYVYLDDPTKAVALSARALDEAEAVGAVGPLAVALMAVWMTIWSPESVDERRGLLAGLDELTADHDLDPTRLLLLQTTSALEDADGGALAGVHDRMTALASTGRYPAIGVVGNWVSSLRAILDGRFEEAERLVTFAHDQMAAFDPTGAFEAYSGQLALLRWEQGRLGELGPLLEQAVVESPHLRMAFSPALAAAWAQSGREDDAVELLDRLALELLDDPPTTMLRAGTVSSLAAACIDLGHTRLAPTALRFLGEAGLTSDGVVDHIGAFYLGARDGYRGGLLRLIGRLDEAIECLRRASNVNRRMGAVVFAIKTDLDLAEALSARAGDGDLAEVAALLDNVAIALASIDLPHERARHDRLSNVTT
jgi:DNA-binding SARP family transcriptional activator